MKHDDDTSVDRKQALKCAARAGSGLVWTLNGGVPASSLIGSAEVAATGFSFVQISDSHIGFNKPANPNPNATLAEAIGKIAGLPSKPALMIHTGDITHLSKPNEFDDADQLIGAARLDGHYVPGEHDVIDENNGAAYLARYGKLSQGKGWYSFDHGGAHCIGLVNVYDLKAGGMGNLGARMMEITETKRSPQREAKTARWRDPPSWRSFAAAMAATVVATLGLQHLIAASNPPDVALQAIVSAHMRSQISGQPVDVVSTDRHTVKPWLAGKLPVAAEVVDLAEAGFPLAGGRIDIVAGAGVPTLVYKRRDHLISVTELRADKADEAAIPRHLAVEGYPVVRWSDGERDYVAVSDLSPTDLDAFVAAFRRAAARERGGGGGDGSLR